MSLELVSKEMQREQKHTEIRSETFPLEILQTKGNFQC